MNRILFFLVNLLVAAFVCTTACSNDPSRGDGTTDSDSDIDTDCPNGKYSGNFEILEQSDVATLAGYTSIGGDLAIMCPSCTDLSELNCLTSVISLVIWGNGTLTNLDGLSGITTLEEGSLQIESNDVLTNLDGLSGITSLGGSLYIENNGALTNLDGLGALTSVEVSLVILDNAALTNLDGLGALTSMLIMGISGNNALTDLDGLSGITSIYWNVDISYNDDLPDCEACDFLDQLTSGPTEIDVHDNLDDSCTPVPANCP